MKYLAFNFPGGYSISTVGGVPEGGIGRLQRVIRVGITYLLIAATLLALAFLIYGGIQWITSGGDKASIESARKKITYALIGLLIVFLAYLIINTVGKFFGANLLEH